MQKDVLNNIISEELMITPKEIKREFPLNDIEKQNINDSKKIIANIIHGYDPRLLVICGPCSIHDVYAALDYAKNLYNLSIELNNQLYIVMRVYLEKPRTILGWKGLINDPNMDNSFDIKNGLKIARKLLLKLVNIGLPLATEVLDPNNFHYIDDMFSWAAIGARTTESQIHREIASGLSMPVGFKNSTDGNLSHAINAIHVASKGHSFIGINQEGQICLLKTNGNKNTHIILRGGKMPNYHPHDILECQKKIVSSGLSIPLMIDCSHGNSNKDYHRQISVAKSVMEQIKAGNCSIIGIMLESYIYSGNQSSELSKSKIRYGVSVTDACIDWSSTNYLLHLLHHELKSILCDRIIGVT